MSDFQTYKGKKWHRRASCRPLSPWLPTIDLAAKAVRWLRSIGSLFSHSASVLRPHVCEIERTSQRGSARLAVRLSCLRSVLQSEVA